MRVSTKELREATMLLLKHLDDTGQSEFEIEEDYYWSVPQDEAYVPYKSPGNLTLGQLSHDWEEVRHLVEGRREPLGYVMVWLSALMRRVGEKALG
jgi:hypothetical protein